jgi:hypothetical protein
MGKKEITFRPVSIYIVDEQTKEPVQGLKIKISNVLLNEISFLVDSRVNYTYKHIETFITNEYGYVQIPAYSYRVKRKFHIYGQFIYINVEPFEQFIQEDKGGGYSGIDFYDRENMYYYRPDEKYKAVLIRSWPRPIFESDRQIERTKPFLMKFNLELPIGTNYEHKEFTIFLERCL